MPEVAREPDPATIAKTDVKEPEKQEPKAETPRRAEPTPATPEPQQRGSTFWPLVFGGLIAGIIGFLVSELDLLGTRSTDDGVRASLASQNDRISALESAEAPAAPEVDLSGIDALSVQVDEITQRLAALDERLVAVEKRPIQGNDEASAAAIEAYERELAGLRTTVDEMIADARSIGAENASAAAEARVREALAEITTAIGSGQPFGDAVSKLRENAQTDVPPALTEVADTGVVTLANLQGRFAEAAREALSTARAAGEMESETGVGGFLRRQLGARSVAPRDGSEPDAVLSRAEAAVRDGQLDTALSELETLSPETRAAIGDWLADARARAAAQAAVRDLSTSLSAN